MSFNIIITEKWTQIKKVDKRDYFFGRIKGVY